MNTLKKFGMDKPLFSDVVGRKWLHATMILALVGILFSCGDKEKPIEPPQEVPVEGIAVTPEKIFLVAGKTQELAAIVNPTNSVSQKVNYASSDSTIAAVNSAGVVTAVKAGATTITASAVADKTKQATVAVEVSVPIVEVMFVQKDLVLPVTQTQQLKALVYPTEARQEVTYESANSAIATVNETGLVTATGLGTVDIIATSLFDKNQKGMLHVTVTTPIEVTVAPNGVFLAKGETHTVAATVTNATNAAVKWTTSNAAVATVSDGVITAVGVGSAHITAASVEDATKKDYVAVSVVNNHISALPRFVVFSDTHFGKAEALRDVPISLQTLFSKLPQPEALFVVGDMTDYGTKPEYDAMLSVFNNPDYIPANVPIYYMMGNHDHYGGVKNYRELLGTEGDLYPLYQHIYMKGHHFITISLLGSNNIGYPQAAKAFLSAALAAAKADDPAKPIFVFMHSPPKNTVYGSDRWGSDETAFFAELLPYPQAIVFAGHSHYTVGNEKSIYQKDYTVVNVGCNTTNGEVVPGVLENLGEGVVVQVEAGGNVILSRWNSLEDQPFLPDWVVEAPHDGSQFK
ncbi:MAG: Ig-like domain-containing protein [Bacteroidales bacterium]|nr:Ig-like domain-containing protein [Bacteroidales bacterium]